MIYLSGQLQAFRSEYSEFIDKSIELHNPTLKAYSIAHEGTAKPRIIGQGVHVLRVIKDAVVSVFTGLKMGVQCFVHHGKDNSTDGRESVAEVVGKGLKVIDGKTHTIAIVNFKDKSNSDYDVISMETPDIEGDKEKGILKYFAPITALALGRSRDGDKPAFPMATLRGAVQFFDYDEHEEKKKMEIDISKLSKEQIKQAVRLLDIGPDELYKSDQLIGTIDISTEGAMELNGNMPDSVKRAFESRLKDRVIIKVDDLNKLKTDSQRFSEIAPKMAEIQKAEKLATVKAEIETSAKARGLTEQQQKYLLTDRVLNGYDFESDTPDLDSFIKNQISVLNETAEILGHKRDEPEQTPTKESGSNSDMLDGF